MEEWKYLHVLDGRLRVKVPEVRRSGSTASEIEGRLRRVKGVTYVRANPLTGNVLVLFNGEHTDPACILSHLKEHGGFNQTANPARPYGRISEFVMKSLTEVLLERAILAVL